MIWIQADWKVKRAFNSIKGTLEKEEGEADRTE